MKLSRKEVAEIREDVDAMLNRYFENKGLIFSMGAIRFNETELGFRVEAMSYQAPTVVEEVSSDNMALRMGLAKPGQTIFFTNNGTTYEAVVIKKNQKTYQVKTTLGIFWKVYFSSCRSAK